MRTFGNLPRSLASFLVLFTLSSVCNPCDSFANNDSPVAFATPVPPFALVLTGCRLLSFFCSGGGPAFSVSCAVVSCKFTKSLNSALTCAACLLCCCAAFFCCCSDRSAAFPRHERTFGHVPQRRSRRIEGVSFAADGSVGTCQGHVHVTAHQAADDCWKHDGCHPRFSSLFFSFFRSFYPLNYR